MSSPIAALDFLIRTLFSLYTFVVLLRIILPLVNANFRNPLCLAVWKLTEPVIKPLRRFIPGFRGVDMAAVMILFALTLIKLSLLSLLKMGGVPNIFGALLWAVGDSLQLTLDLFFYTVLIVIVLSWVNPHSYNPIVEVLHQITSPIMQPARRIIPPIAGLDLSPIAVIIAIQLLGILIVSPLMSAGMALAF